MKKYFRYLVILAVLLLCLAGCETNPDPVPTVEPTAVPTETTLPPETEPPLDPYALYADAAAATKEDLGMALFIKKEVRIADTVVTSSSEQSITYLGHGTDHFLAKVNETATYGDYSVKYEEVFAEGMVYAAIDSHDFAMEISAEDFASRYLPPVMLTGELYKTLTYDEATGVFTFADATALESWLLDEEVQILQADGTATVTNGTITEATYAVTYTIGGAEISLDVKQILSVPAVQEITKPYDAAKHTDVEQIDAVKLVDQVYGYLLEANVMDVMILESTVSHAAGMVLNYQTNLSIYDVGKNPMFQVDNSIFYMDAGNNRESSDVLEVYRDGKYTITEDDGRPSPSTGITASMMRTYYQNMLTEYILSTAYLQTATGTDMGGILLAEFTCTDDLGNAMCADICDDLFGDSKLLDSYASAYRNETLEFYVAADKYTGLPTAMGFIYEGIHTIDGQECLLSKQIDYSIDLAGLDVYEDITDELAPETEPEEKATPLLYHVTGPDGQEMWLFGTIHVGDERTGFLPQEIYDAFAASDALAIECNTTAFEEQLEEDDALSEEISDLYYYSDGTTAKDHITDEQLYEDAVKMMKATGSYNMNTQYLKPSIWAQDITNSFLSFGKTLTGSKGVESRLEKLAEEQNKPILEVESVTFQISMTTGYSDELQEQLLAEAVYSPSRGYWDSVHELYEQWCRGDEAELIEALRDDTSEMTEEELKLYNEYNNAISVDRNEGMLKAAIDYLESGDTVFFSVGLAHLLADNGLVNALREAGYTVELVQYK